ncbi:hypothetical protein BGZ80_007996 [Entomortierella chlamydospora]|uniref:Uncharacterized protein n=1 Tax=Entomortierella chlamydospora TaxID=101097 RepID=A0A9P6SRL6_9FUNG|nr:hypothetical protein BGZ79_004176 [Entomortierella chlamydospora]KAF9993913.1 hypothetical protein BGZ80_007996 [Entomortierella chlamydospora]
MIEPASFGAAASGALALASAIVGTDNKHGKIRATEHRLNMYTTIIATHIVATDPDTRSEIAALSKTIQKLHTALNEKGRSGLSRLVKPNVRFNDILSEIAALDGRLMTLLQYSNVTPPAMMRVSDWFRQMEANSPPKLNEILTQIAQLLQALMENSVVTLRTNPRAIEYLEPHRNLPNIPWISGRDLHVARNQRAVVDQLQLKFKSRNL